MAPDDLNLTVDFNDASFEDESSDDAYIPETWASNRNSSTGDNASMAVLGAGSEAAHAGQARREHRALRFSD